MSDDYPCHPEHGDAPHVCPGCHAVGEERCAPGCIDAERQRAIESWDYGCEEDDDG